MGESLIWKVMNQRNQLVEEDLKAPNKQTNKIHKSNGRRHDSTTQKLNQVKEKQTINNDLEKGKHAFMI